MRIRGRSSRDRLSGQRSRGSQRNRAHTPRHPLCRALRRHLCATHRRHFAFHPDRHLVRPAARDRPYDIMWLPWYLRVGGVLPRFFHSRYGRDDLHRAPRAQDPDPVDEFIPSKGQTCGAWANEFTSAIGGYLGNANDTSGCRYCCWRGLLDPVEYRARGRPVRFTLLLVVIASRLLGFGERQGSRRNW